MNDSTPLLGQVIGHIPPTDSDLFIKAVESPWDCISGRSLFSIRFFLAFTMTLILSIYFTLETLAGRGKIIAFRLMNLAWIGQCTYLWLTSYWMYLCAISRDQCRLPYTYTCRRYRPYSADVSLSTIRGVFNSCLFHITSFPSDQNGWNLSLFHTLYTMAMVLPLTSMLLYFLLLLPTGHPVIELEFVLSTFSPTITLMEFFVLNSVVVSSSARDQRRMFIQVLILASLAVFYCKLWTRIGNRIVHGPEEKLDWRFFGGGWNGYCRPFTLVAINTVCGLYTVLWVLELAKGWILEWRKQELVKRFEEGLLAPHASLISSGSENFVDGV